MIQRKITEKINEFVYSSKDRIHFILQLTDNLTLVIALGTLIYSVGFNLEADEITWVFRWLEALILIFVLDYFIRMFYSFGRWKYIQEHLLESILVFLYLFLVLGYLFQIDIPYGLFLLLKLSDYRSFYEFFIASYVVILTILAIARASHYISAIKIKPATTFISSFIILILIGTMLLRLPAMTTQPGSMPFLAALFTSTSASCVTGLSVVTVATYFTFKGQLVILFLLQLGGIGIVSFATFFATFLTQGVGLKQQAIIQDVLSSESLSSARQMLKQVILLTFAIEAVGALAIFFSWGPDVQFYSPVPVNEEVMEMRTLDSLETALEEPEAVSGAGLQEEELLEGPIDLSLLNGAPETTPDPVRADSSTDSNAEHSEYALDILFVEGEQSEDPPASEAPNFRINNSLANKIYYSIFHSVSAFCNAGFSLFPNGLAEEYVDRSYIFHLVIGLIIILGSMGFSNIQQIASPRRLRERMSKPWKQWGLSTQIAVNMTLILTGLGMLGFYILEQDYSLNDKNLFEALTTAFFQSVTTRTAGFNTVSLSLSDISQPTYIMFIFLMFIGANSGSTGGGIKTSTFFLLVISAFASIRGKKNAEIGRRSISNDTISRAFSIVSFAIAYNLVCIFILLIVQPNINILDLFFELISAFATVGLSTGITSLLNEYSQAILILTMYIGRVGMLTLALALSKKVISTSYQYPVSHVMVG